MKEHIQKPGVRKWAGEDLIELQEETLSALQALVEPYAPCIVQGCEVTHANGVYQVQPGIVALKGNNENGNACTKIVRFAGYTGEVLPIYLTIKVTPYMRVYADEENKPIAYEYTAEPDTNQPDVPYLKIDADGGERLVDTIGITQKLDREGGNASNVKVAFSTSTARSNITTGSTLKETFGRIARWFSDLKTLAFKDKVSKTDLDTSLTTEFNNKVDKVSGKGLSTNDFTTTLKDKLEKIAPGANNYTHPTGSGNNHIPAGGSSGQYLKYSSAGTAAWATPSSNVASSSAAGFMSATDKSKLDGIDSGANNYAHPTGSGNNHIPAGGSSGQYLKYSSAGTAAWAIPSSNVATSSAAGFMSAADKSKLDGIDSGANNYAHPTGSGNNHIPSGGSSGQYLKYSSAGSAAWATPSSNVATSSAAGFMSATDKGNLDNLFKFRIVGYYTLTKTATVGSYSGLAITCNKVSTPVDPCYSISLPTANGFSASKTYCLICFAGYEHTIEGYDSFVKGGGSFTIIYRNRAGTPTLSDYSPRIVIIELN